MNDPTAESMASVNWWCNTCRRWHPKTLGSTAEAAHSESKRRLAETLLGQVTAERDDLVSRLGCVVEATYWDRPYDTRIAAIRGMCDLSQNGMTPTEDGGETIAEVLARCFVLTDRLRESESLLAEEELQVEERIRASIKAENAAQRDRLAARVAAVEALLPDAMTWAEPHGHGPLLYAEDVRVALATGAAEGGDERDADGQCALLPNDGDETCLTHGVGRDRACDHCRDTGWPDWPEQARAFAEQVAAEDGDDADLEQCVTCDATVADDGTDAILGWVLDDEGWRCPVCAAEGGDES